MIQALNSHECSFSWFGCFISYSNVHQFSCIFLQIVRDIIGMMVISSCVGYSGISHWAEHKKSVTFIFLFQPQETKRYWQTKMVGIHFFIVFYTFDSFYKFLKKVEKWFTSDLICLVILTCLKPQLDDSLQKPEILTV